MRRRDTACFNPVMPLPSLDDIARFEPLLIELHRAAAAETLPRFRAGVAVDDKGGANTVDGGFDPVTEADRGAERAIRRLIAEHHPDHGVIGEEEGEDRPDAEWTWVLDPVDGTRAFISGLPLWVTLIGLNHRGRPVLGSIGQPYIGELFLGHAGGSRLLSRGASRPLRVRPRRLAEATLAATDPHSYFDEEERAAWTAVKAASRLTRLGGDGYLFALVALGGVDLVVESGLKRWDIEPCIPVVEGAGGVVTDWTGRPLADAGLGARGQVCAAGDRECLDEALKSLTQAAK